MSLDNEITTNYGSSKERNACSSKSPRAKATAANARLHFTEIEAKLKKEEAEFEEKIIVEKAAAGKKGAAEALERVTSAGPTGRSKGSAIRSLHPNSSPVYKTQSETAVTAGLHNLSLKDTKTKPQQQFKRGFSTKANGNGTVKNLNNVAELLQGDTIKNIVVVAGAGISTPSGIPDFRTPGTGLYDNLQQYQIPYPEAIFDIDYFHHNPRPFFTLAKELYPSGKYRPNYIHYFVRLLHDKGKLLRMYTQNIDGLERLAGLPAERLVEAHGTFSSCTCTICGNKQEGESIKEKIFADKLPRCPTRGCVGIVKPDIVFFGEDLPRKFYSYMKDMLQTDLVLVMGTSLEVQPFAGIIDTVRYQIPRVLFNREAVGPFRYGKRSQDLVAEGDLIDRLVKFSNLVGWKQDMVDLITREEGEFKVAFKPPPTVVTKRAAGKKINHKPPPPPPSNQRRNYSSLAYKGNFQGRSAYVSSSEESSDSESDCSSSDSSDDGGKNKKRGTNKTIQKRGKASNHMNQYKPLQRCLSAKANNVRKVHTDASQQNNRDVNGNITGRSVKSESGVNPNAGKNRIEHQKSNTKAKPNSVAKTPSVGDQVTKEERDKVLRKYGLSPGPKVISSEKAVNPAKPPRKNVTAFEEKQGKSDSASTANDKDTANDNPQLKHVRSENSMVGSYFIEDVRQNIIKENAEETTDEAGVQNTQKTDSVAVDSSNDVTVNAKPISHVDDIKVTRKSPSQIKQTSPQNLDSKSETDKNAEELSDKAPILKNNFKDELSVPEIDKGIFILEKPEDNKNSNDVIEAINMKHAKLQSDLQRKSAGKERLNLNSEMDLQHNVLGSRAFIGERNELIQLPVPNSSSNEELVSINSDDIPASDKLANKTPKRTRTKSKSLGQPRSSSQNSVYEKYVQAQSVYSDGHIHSRKQNKTLSQKAAESFAKYANLGRRKGREGAGLKDLRRHNGSNRTHGKPPISGRIPGHTTELNEVNPLPYGFATRRKPHVKGAGPYRRTNVRAHNNAVEYTEALLRSGSAEIPKISYRHKVEPLKLYSVGMYGSLIVKQEVRSPEKEAWTTETEEKT